MLGVFNNNQVDFDKWSKFPYDRATVDKELEIQKKRMYPDDQKPPFNRPVTTHRVPLRSARMVSFQDEVNPITGLEPLAVQKLNQGLHQVSIGVGTE